ncbi:Ku protein [Streptomyces sp. NPDC091272]|uniref:non-homologous end joining protein Ku n=1 Tax=Streptomyces sp. NPDC091272 TaxID=3365981 RepID=UPI0037F5F321
MPRPVWSGAVSFGLVSIPVKVLPATENHNISFHQYHLEDLGRVRYQKVCDLDGEVLNQDQIGKAYEVAKDTLVEITDEELDNIPLPTAKAIEVVGFVPSSSIDPVRIGTSYYLAADGPVAAKPYVLLRRALERSSKVAVAKFAWHGRERLGLLRILDDALVLHAMKWPDEIRSPDELAPRTVDLDDEEVDAAVSLMEEMTTDDGLEGYRDHYREALEELLAAKSGGRRPAAPQGGEEKQKETVVDLMSALQQSVRSARASRGEGDGEGEGDASVHDLGDHAQKKAARAKKTPAKKAAEKKTAAKKAPAKKTAARRSSA